jgi:hypothetical protein
MATFNVVHGAGDEKICVIKCGERMLSKECEMSGQKKDYEEHENVDNICVNNENSRMGGRKIGINRIKYFVPEAEK